MDKELEKALECLENYKKHSHICGVGYEKYDKWYDTIKQALIKAQEDKEQLKLVKALYNEKDKMYENLKKYISKLDVQIYPVGMYENKDLFLIHNKEEIIQQLRSLQYEAKLNTSTFKDPVFYKDYNALKIVIETIEIVSEIIEKELK